MKRKEIIKKIIDKHGMEGKILKYIDNWNYVEYNENSYAILFINPNIDSNEKIAFFGFIDFPNETDPAMWLFKKLLKESKKLGAKQLMGPLNYSTWFSYRWTIDGWNDIKVAPEPTNEKYMPEFAKSMGFSEYLEYFSSIIQVSNDEKHKNCKKKYENSLTEGFEFERYEGKKVKKVLNDLYKISKEVFANKPLYSPISKMMFKRIYISAFNKIDPVVDICLYKNKPIGFSFYYEDPYDKRILTWKTVALKKEYQGHSLGSAFRYLVHQQALENNHSSVVQLLMHVESKSKQLISDGEVFRKYALFSKKI